MSNTTHPTEFPEFFNTPTEQRTIVNCELPLLIKKARELRKELSIESEVLKHIINRLKSDPDDWVFILNLLCLQPITELERVFVLLHYKGRFGEALIYVAREGLIVKSETGSKEISDMLLQNERISGIVKKIMFLLAVIDVVSVSINVQYICDVDKLCIKKKPLIYPNTEPVVINSTEYGGKELFHWVINEIIKP